MTRGRPDPRVVFRISGEFRRFRPHVVQCWMYHANLLGGIASALGGGIPVVWGIHHTEVNGQNPKILTLNTVKACALLSHWLPKRIVCCAESTKKVHIDIGYAAEKMIVINNGIDPLDFFPDLTHSTSFRQQQ